MLRRKSPRTLPRKSDERGFGHSASKTHHLNVGTGVVPRGGFRL